MGDTHKFDYEDFWGSGSYRRSRSRKKRKGPGSVLTSLLLVVAMLGIFAGTAYLAYEKSAGFLGNLPIITPPGEPGNPAEGGKARDGRVAILLIGTDQRNREPSRADTIMVAFVDPDGGEFSLLSIPRDTYAQIPGRGKEKIAHAHAYGGPDLLMKTVENLLHIPIVKYVELNFRGFEGVIDILGGVEIEVEKAMYYPPEGIDLKPGLQRLNGNQALQYVRYRSDGDDLTRIKRQQRFLGAVAEQALRISSLVKIPELAKEINAYTQTNLNTKEMIGLARILKESGTSKFDAATLPGDPRYIDRVSYWVPHHDDIPALIARMTGQKMLAGKGQ